MAAAAAASIAGPPAGSLSGGKSMRRCGVGAATAPLRVEKISSLTDKSRADGCAADLPGPPPPPPKMESLNSANIIKSSAVMPSSSPKPLTRFSRSCRA